jgi:hypothetical protein
MPKLAARLLLLLLASQLSLTNIYGGQSLEADKRRRAEAAADLFIRRFRETRDFGRVFDELTVSDAFQRLRRAGELISFGLDESLAKEIDERTAVRFYKALMNLIYLRSVYAMSRKVGVIVDPYRARLPRALRRVVNKSKQLRFIYSHSIEDFPSITNQRDLQQFIADMERMSALYRKLLPRGVFNSAAYRANVGQLESERGDHYGVDEGDDYYGIAETVEVYGLCRDIFCFRLVEEGGKLKVLGFVFD